MPIQSPSRCLVDISGFNLKIKLDVQFLHNLQFEFIAVQSLQFFRPSPSKYMLKLYIHLYWELLVQRCIYSVFIDHYSFFPSSNTFSTQTTVYDKSSLRLASLSNIIFYLSLTIRLLLNLSCCGFKFAFLWWLMRLRIFKAIHVECCFSLS